MLSTDHATIPNLRQPAAMAARSDGSSQLLLPSPAEAGVQCGQMGFTAAARG